MGIKLVLLLYFYMVFFYSGRAALYPKYRAAPAPHVYLFILLIS